MEKEIQRKYMQYQLLQQQIKGLIEQKMALDEKQNEINESIEAVRNANNIKKDNEIWSSVGSGVYVSSSISDSDKFLVSIGASVALKKSAEEAVRILKSRLSEIEELDNQLMNEINKYGTQLKNTEQELQKMVENSESE